MNTTILKSYTHLDYPMKLVVLLVGLLVTAAVVLTVESKKSVRKKSKSNRKSQDESVTKTRRNIKSQNIEDLDSGQKKKEARSRKRERNSEGDSGHPNLGFVFTWHQSPVHLRSKDYRYHHIAVQMDYWGMFYSLATHIFAVQNICLLQNSFHNSCKRLFIDE